MSNYCRSCRYDPKDAAGEQACPFTTLYWDFLAQHRERLAGNRRMNFQIKNLERKGEAERTAIADRARYIRRKIREGSV